MPCVYKIDNTKTTKLKTIRKSLCLFFNFSRIAKYSCFKKAAARITKASNKVI